MSDLTVQHADAGDRGSFFIEKDGTRLAEMTYTRRGDALVVVDHTEVSDALRGQGAGRRLLDALVAWARQAKTKVLPLCSYARAQFEKDASLRDVLSA